MAILDAIFGSGGSDAANQALGTINQIPLPILKEYYPELYKQIAQLNPELETAVKLGPSEMQGIATDPTLKLAQMKALSKLQEVGDAGGMDAQAMADQTQLESDINRNLRGNQQAIMQNLATRGQSGGGSELVARQLAAQDAANRQAQMGMDNKAQAQQRALNAIMQSGQLGSQMQQSDFAQAQAKAQAQDAIAKFNAANQQDVGARNVAAKNQAQQYNVGGAQNIANLNTGGQNEAKKYNLGLSQQEYENQLRKAGMLAGQYQNIAGREDRSRAEDKQLVGGLISAGASLYGAPTAPKV